MQGGFSSSHEFTTHPLNRMSLIFKCLCLSLSKAHCSPTSPQCRPCTSMLPMHSLDDLILHLGTLVHPGEWPKNPPESSTGSLWWITGRFFRWYHVLGQKNLTWFCRFFLLGTRRIQRWWANVWLKQLCHRADLVRNTGPLDWQGNWNLDSWNLLVSLLEP